MNTEDINQKDTFNSIKSVDNIKTILLGLNKIFELNFDNNDFFLQLAEDNIKELGTHIPKLLDDNKHNKRIIEDFKNFQIGKQNKDKQKRISINP